MGYRTTESSLRKACLVSVRRNYAHRTLATALGLARCGHGNVYALSSAVPLHLFFKVQSPTSNAKLAKAFEKQSFGESKFSFQGFFQGSQRK